MLGNLKKLRWRLGESQKQLADVIGVSQQSINKYENHDVEPDLKTLIAMADHFQTSVDYLIGHTEIPHVVEWVAPFDLNREEARAMELYRRLTRRERDSVLLVMENYVEKN